MTLYPSGLAVYDRNLWDAAVAALSRTYRTGRHEVAAAIRTRDGAVHLGVHMAGSAGRSSVCAEAMALGAVLANTEPARSLADEIDTVLAVLYRPGPDRGTIRIVSACGLCREILVDYCPDAWNYVHVFEQAPVSGEVSSRPEPTRGITGPIALAPGGAQRWRVRDLMPGKNIRPW
ncbi:hypothetical protein [Nocardia sp. NPDC003963]